MTAVRPIVLSLLLLLAATTSAWAEEAAGLRDRGLEALRLGDAATAEEALRAALKAGAAEADVAVPLARALMLQGRAQALLLLLPEGDRPAAIEGEIRFWRGLAQAAEDDGAAALRSFAEAARRRPEDPRPHLAMAQELTAQRRLAEAEAAAEAALAQADEPSRRAEALTLKGELRRMAGDGGAAEQLFAEALMTDPSSQAALVGRATLAMAAGRGAEAEQDARRVLDMAPDHPVARYLVAAAQAARQDLDGALATLHDLQGQAYPPALLLRATLHLNRNNLERTRQDLDAYQAAAGPDARGLRLRGALHLRLREPALAVTALEQAGALAPDDVQTAALLAAAHLLNGDMGKAARSLDSETGLRAVRDLARQMPDSPLPPTLAGTVLAARGDVAAARAELGQALAHDPDFLPALLTLARLDADDDRPDAARLGFLKVLALAPEHAGAMTGLAGLAARLGQGEAARDWLDRARQAAPHAVAPRLEQIELSLRGGDTAAALAAVQTLAEDAPDDPAVLEALGKVSWVAGERDQALAAFRRLAELMPRSPKAGMLLVSALAGSGRAEEALAAAEAAAARDDDYLPARAQRLQLLLGAGQGDRAAAEAAAWAARHPESVGGALLLADVHLRRGDGAAAAVVLEAAFARHPSTPLAIRLAEARLRAGRGEDGAAGLAAWLAEHPDQTAARAALAALHLRLGRFDLARADWEAVVAADAGNAVALNNLAWLYQRTGDPRALALAEQAYRLDPRSPQIADTLGSLLVRQQELGRGLALLRQAHAAAPRQPEIRYHLAQALALAGEIEEARLLLDALVAENADFEDAAAARDLHHSLGGG